MAKRTHRRVRTQPAPGSDPAPASPASTGPAAEDDERSSGELPATGSGANDDRLRQDKPPHY